MDGQRHICLRCDSADCHYYRHCGARCAAHWDGNVDLQQKDMMLALTLGRKMGMPLPLGAASNEMLNACRGLGLQHNDFVTVFEVYRKMGGMS